MAEESVTAPNWARLPAHGLVFGMIISNLSLQYLYSCLQVCKEWHSHLMDSRYIWTRECRRQGFITYPRDEEHPSDKCRRLLSLLQFRNFMKHVKISNLNLEELAEIDGIEKTLFSAKRTSYVTDVTPEVCVGDGVICVASPSGKYIIFILFFFYFELYHIHISPILTQTRSVYR